MVTILYTANSEKQTKDYGKLSEYYHEMPSEKLSDIRAHNIFALKFENKKYIESIAKLHKMVLHVIILYFHYLF